MPTPSSCGKVLKGEIDPALASRLSQMFVNQRTLLETSDVEAKLVRLEEKLAELLAKGAGSTVVQFRKAGPFD